MHVFMQEGVPNAATWAATNHTIMGIPQSPSIA